MIRRHKYNAKPTFYDGVRYDSKAEAAHAARLDLAKRAGAIADWKRQVPIDIGDPGIDRPYRVDFVVTENDGSIHAEEVKGVETSRFKRQKKQWAKRGPCPLWIFKKGKRVEVIEGGGA